MPLSTTVNYWLASKELPSYTVLPPFALSKKPFNGYFYLPYTGSQISVCHDVFVRIYD